jgi:disulfide bond formation protein DsbB
MKFDFNHFVRGHLRHYLSWAALLALPFIVSQRPGTVGVLLIFIGAALRVYASGFLDKEGRLTIGGPFAYVRNPLYLGTFLMAAGAAQSQNAWIALVVICGISLSLLYSIVQAEEKVLAEKFPKTFPRYCIEVPRFFPRLTKFKSFHELKNSDETRAQDFSSELFMRNRGYEALITGVGLTALLFLVHYAITRFQLQ